MCVRGCVCVPLRVRLRAFVFVIGGTPIVCCQPIHSYRHERQIVVVGANRLPATCADVSVELRSALAANGRDSNSNSYRTTSIIIISNNNNSNNNGAFVYMA